MRITLFLTVFAFSISSICATGKVTKCTGRNEIFSKCGNHPCQNTCEEPNRIASCTYEKKCYPGCVCKPGFLRNCKGVCVAAKTCYTCSPTEVFSECGAHGCQNTCAEPDLSTRCDPLPGCFPGCVCKEGHLRNGEGGKCIPACECPNAACTGANQVWSECDAHPCQNTCEDPNLITKCTYQPGCYPGCICADGFLKNASGECVPSGPCLSNQCTGQNEEYQECGTACPRTCANKDVDVIACTKNCVQGCFCKAGFVRNEEGVCIPPEECPITCDDPNAEVVDCPNPCPGGTCEQPNFTPCKIACRRRGCQCKKGYVKNAEGKCILLEQCPNRQCGENEAFTDCVCPCCENCSNLGQDVICNFLVCNPGCDCKAGFFRNADGACVAPDKCQCKENEEYTPAWNPCPPQTCDAIGKAFKCPVVTKPACKCRFNYRRDASGICIPMKDCPQAFECKGENEVYDSCPYQCLDERCASLYEPPRICPKIGKECNPQCVCREGYLRNKDGVCILKEHCEEYCADPRTVFDPCGDIYPITCANKDRLRIKAGDCLKKGACVCSPQFVRNLRGECVPPEECPSCGAYEVFACGSPLDKTCAKLGEPRPKFGADGKCVERCYCVDGYARDADDACVPIKQCPKKPCKANEKYNPCPYSCPPEATCASYLSGIIVDCAAPPEDRECIPRCECAEGYVRKTEGGECVKQNKCCDDPNAEVVSCPNPCPGGTCEAPKFADCKAPCKILGCQCKKGFVKDADGKCILLSKCPKTPKCKKNEVYKTCGTACPATCAVRSRPCTKQCVQGCFCKDGFILDKDKGNCIPIDQCPNTTCTGVNEEYDECGTACPLTCENKDEIIICTEQCVAGCFCKKGFVRKNGVCVDPKACDCGKNEDFNELAPTNQETCATRGKKIKPGKKGPGCVCKKGWVRECNKGKCIKSEKCKK